MACVIISSETYPTDYGFNKNSFVILYLEVGSR